VERLDGLRRTAVRAYVRAEESYEPVRDLLVHWPTRLVMSVATVALAAGLAVVIVTVLS
jgi:hypothetical protein